MSIYTKSSSAIKGKKEVESPENQETEPQLAEIIPWPFIEKAEARKAKAKKRVRLDGKYLYLRGKKIPILQFQKSGYDKLLKLLVKEIR